ncbi:excalibur calcium-binding domain-containing protein [Streptomyces erythrochromogenes]|uniref:Excalibur calcium-binding domain-containing protein n=1 Tax=Streptomyces erythrochromogenes TaxID=285574 RepID=A0ABZ1Q448_9ACTN|nr:excalibur calcium-binding domain-containing protein [Streptomyces erythrochromogenes]
MVGTGREHPRAPAGAAGAVPLERGGNGYRDALDRDGDGVACDPYFGR